MRQLAGIAVLLLGVSALGLWANRHQAVRIEAEITAASASAVQGARHAVATQVAGRDITVSGIANDEAERQSLLAALEAVKGRRVVNDRLSVLPKAAPYHFGADKTGAGALAGVTGNVPSEALRARLAEALGGAEAAGALQLANGAPEGQDWGRLVEAGLAALGPLMQGSLRIDDSRVQITGTVDGPAEEAAVLALLAALPAGATGTAELEVLHPAPVAPEPAGYALGYSAGAGARLSGLLPAGLLPAEIGAALGLAAVQSEATEMDLAENTTPEVHAALAAEGKAGLATLGALARWLPQIEEMKLGFAGAKLDAQGQALAPAATEAEITLSAGSDAELIGAALGEALGKGVALRLAVAAPETVAPAVRERVNAATGQREAWQAGYWLPRRDFTADLAGCARESEAVLGQFKIGFVTGSARLDAEAARAVSELASVLGPCLAAGLQAELSGHTDATGNPEANLALSLARAEAVQAALLARGVPPGGLRAAGYGAERPIASNDTEEGRAANRRTAVDWSE